MRQAYQIKETMPHNRFTVGYARTAGELLEAQRLRYNVFAEEMGARLASADRGIDVDRFDEFCDHLLVRDAAAGEIVGTYRILSPDGARRAGGNYSESEFDLARLAHIMPRLVEVGRSCIHPDYRSGTVIALLWSGLARYMNVHGYEFLAGCASIPMHDGGHAAAAIYRRLRAEHISPPEYRVMPRCALPLEALGTDGPVDVPPLVKGYLRLGAWIAGAPAWDPDFNTADLFVLLPMAHMNVRYARHYLGNGGSPTMAQTSAIAEAA